MASNVCPCRRRPTLVDARSEGVPFVVPVALQEVDALSSVRIYIPKDLRPPDARTLALKVALRSLASVHCSEFSAAWD